MTVVLVTAPPGREGDAILELEWSLGRVKVRGTDWRGVLIGETPLPGNEVVERLRNFETQAIQRLIPFDRFVSARWEELERAALELGEKIDGTFAVRARVRGNKKLSAREIEIRLGSVIVGLGKEVNLGDPDYTLLVEVLGKRAGLSLVRRGELPRFEVRE